MKILRFFAFVALVFHGSFYAIYNPLKKNYEITVTNNSSKRARVAIYWVNRKLLKRMVGVYGLHSALAVPVGFKAVQGTGKNVGFEHNLDINDENDRKLMAQFAAAEGASIGVAAAGLDPNMKVAKRISREIVLKPGETRTINAEYFVKGIGSTRKLLYNFENTKMPEEIMANTDYYEYKTLNIKKQKQNFEIGNTIRVHLLSSSKAPTNVAVYGINSSATPVAKRISMGYETVHPGQTIDLSYDRRELSKITLRKLFVISSKKPLPEKIRRYDYNNNYKQNSVQVKTNKVVLK